MTDRPAICDRRPAPPCPAPFNLAACVLARSDALGDKPALEILSPEGAQTLTHAALARRVRQVASGLRALGLRPGDRLLMRLGNSVEFPLVYLGAIHAGIVPAPTSAQLTGPEITAIARDLRPRAIVAAPGVALPDERGEITIGPDDLRRFETLGEADPELGDPDRPAYVIFTSGTGGRARGVIHAHRAIWARRLMWDGWYGLREDDRLLHAGAFNWTYTLGTGLMDPWAIGATALIPAPGVSPGDLGRLLHRHGATIFAAAPGVYRQILRAGLGRSEDLRHGLSAGEKLPQATARAWREATGTEIHEAFGMSECSTFISGAPGESLPEGALGRVQPGRRVAILTPDGVARLGEAGTIAVSRDDPGLMLGYLGGGEEEAARLRGDWFLTGDSGVMDGSGAVTYLGREDDMLNAGGYRVSPLEIEAAMREAPGIGECAAIEVEVKADTRVIALCHTGRAPSGDLQAHAARVLARYKQPRLYFRVGEMPRNANGKVMRRALKARFSSGGGG